ncbi:SLC13 family permease [Bifidobacterium psychraerophilum]|uniref:SLC13 family permease n=1 Tax=Bifidobacterium psychraerophilum TaxID=218140 RepID=UPI0012FDFF57
MCAIVTAALSLDTTVLLLTPVILHMTNRARADFRPYVYAACHLANTASLLLPVSNLTNLLAMNSSGLDFLAFARTMFLPWCAAIAVEYIVMRIAFRFSFQMRSCSKAGPNAMRTVPVKIRRKMSRSLPCVW